MRTTLTKRPGSENWYLRGSVNGKRFLKSTGVSDREAAENIRIRSEAQNLERVSLGKKATATFAEAAITYIQSGGEARFLGPILRHFGPRARLSEIDNAAVIAAAAKIYPTAKPATVNRQLIGPISAVLRLAAEDGLCEVKTLRRRKVTEKKTRWLTPEEFEPFAAALPGHQTPIIGFMIGTGARVRETLCLKASTFYPNNRQALLVDTKNGQPRMVRYPDRAAAMIELCETPDAGPVFLTDRGEPYSIPTNRGGQIRRAFNRARDAAGLGADVTPHTIRHTWATWYYSQTRDFGGLLDLGGWSKADIANIYRKISPDDLADRLFAHGWDFRHGAALASGRSAIQQAIRK